MNQTRINRHAKIVCTIGPASSSSEIIENILRNGMDIARFNLSYGTFEEHSRYISLVRSLGRQLQLPVGILIDLPGKKRRSGSIEDIFGQHLDFAISQNADFIALSFISSAREVRDVKELLTARDVSIPIIVKIERLPALQEAVNILGVCEGIMVARGDLALDINIEKVPLAQKHLIKEANRCGKPVITATQMLESMVRSDTPTRAEATDVANAVLDGTDALMTSEETAMGKYPAEAVRMMEKIVLEAETGFPYEHELFEKWPGILPEVNDATARAACQMAHQVQAKVIVAFTTGGTTALRVSKYRPFQPILGLTPFESVMNRLTIAWGVLPVIRPASLDLNEIFEVASEVALETGIAAKGDLLVITAGLPLTVPGSTNLVKIHCI
jgi:pyruvate kinase